MRFLTGRLVGGVLASARLWYSGRVARTGRLFLLVTGAVLLAAACGTSTTGPGVGGVSGYVFEGPDPYGSWSGRPVSGARVRYEGPDGAVEVSTAPDGFFAIGRTPSGAFTVHVLPPSPRLAGLSVYGLSAVSRPLSLYLTVREGLPNPPRFGGRSPAPAVRGRLFSSSGSPQPGSSPGFGSPGDPGTVGFVWWGFYRAQVPGCPRCYSTVAGPDGGFEIQGMLGGEMAASTRPFFAGNYDGVADGGRVLHYTQFFYRPAVDVLRTGPADLGDVALVPVHGFLTVAYDSSATSLVNGYGPGGLSYAFVQMYPSIASDPLELAEAAAGPAAGGGLGGQLVSVPQIPESASTYFFAQGFAFDLNAPVTAELAVTTAFRVGGGPLRVGYLTPARSVRTGSGTRRTLSWVAPSGATVQYAAVTDSGLVPVWEVLAPGGVGSASLPVDLAPGSYYVFVYANDADHLEEVVTGLRWRPARHPGRWRAAGQRRPLRSWSTPRLDRTPFSGNMFRESYSDLVQFSVP